VAREGAGDDGQGATAARTGNWERLGPRGKGGCPFIGGARCLASKEPSTWVAVRRTGRDTAGTGGLTGSSSCRSGAACGPTHGARGRTSRRLGVLPALGRGGLSKMRASPDVEAAVRCSARAGG
jgi:hypothetical protein